MKGDKFVSREVAVELLVRELEAVGYTCSIFQSDRVVEDGAVVLETESGERLMRSTRAGRKVLLDANRNEVSPGNARPRTTERYISIDCNEVIDREKIQAVLDAHDVTPQWRDDRKGEALIKAKALLNPSSSLTTSADWIKTVQKALDDLYVAMDTMTLADLKVLDLGTWSGWPTEPT